MCSSLRPTSRPRPFLRRGIALQGIQGKGHVGPGHQVLINGAGGGSGMYAVQLAQLLGAEVTGVDNTEKLGFMRSLGAGHVIDYTREDFTRNERTYGPDP